MRKFSNTLLRLLSEKGLHLTIEILVCADDLLNHCISKTITVFLCRSRHTLVPRFRLPHAKDTVCALDKVFFSLNICRLHCSRRRVLKLDKVSKSTVVVNREFHWHTTHTVLINCSTMHTPSVFYVFYERSNGSVVFHSLRITD